MDAVLVNVEECKGVLEMTALLYDKFEMPEEITLDSQGKPQTFGRFVAEPLERGFGHTLGNALRRMLLTSIETPAIISFHMEGVAHEYGAIEGVIEDVTTIILNLKGGLLRKIVLDDGKGSVHEQKLIVSTIEVTQSDLDTHRQKVITFGDLIKSTDYELVNPELPIFTVTAPMKKRVELKVTMGRGYVPSEKHMIHSKLVDEIVIDSIFSPVKLVNYFVEDTRVGQDTDFDRLVLEVETDGRVTPQEALSFASKILVKHLNVFEKMNELVLTFEEPAASFDNDRDDLMSKLALGINEIELSVRSTNCLEGAHIALIGELVVRTEAELLQYRNFGKKSLNEIKAKLFEMGLSLGMDLSKFGITKDNIKEKIERFHEGNEKKGQ